MWTGTFVYGLIAHSSCFCSVMLMPCPLSGRTLCCITRWSRCFRKSPPCRNAKRNWGPWEQSWRRKRYGEPLSRVGVGGGVTASEHELVHLPSGTRECFHGSKGRKHRRKPCSGWCRSVERLMCERLWFCVPCNNSYLKLVLTSVGTNM